MSGMFRPGGPAGMVPAFFCLGKRGLSSEKGFFFPHFSM
ncbi:hypothetical protein B4135_2658 [Caldibacillus debilis]|uniref:Uncharacterized protein n=1 Tax=Caldibacillus debilis TaxID=301148 RepID=A0A150LW51_9BACI|nr:hypothetical protein B4135_2658 [Caldibacillus debilis]